MFGEWGEEVEADEFLVKINAFVVSRFISIIFCVLSLCVSQPGFKDYALLNYVSSFVFLFIRTNLIFNLVGEYFLIRSPTLIVPGCWGVCASWLYYIQWSCFFFMIYESFLCFRWCSSDGQIPASSILEGKLWFLMCLACYFSLLV